MNGYDTKRDKYRNYRAMSDVFVALLHHCINHSTEGRIVAAHALTANIGYTFEVMGSCFTIGH